MSPRHSTAQAEGRREVEAGTEKKRQDKHGSIQ